MQLIPSPEPDDGPRTPFITAVLARRDNPRLPEPPAAPLSGYWLAPPPAEDADQ